MFFYPCPLLVSSLLLLITNILFRILQWFSTLVPCWCPPCSSSSPTSCLGFYNGFLPVCPVGVLPIPPHHQHIVKDNTMVFYQCSLLVSSLFLLITSILFRISRWLSTSVPCSCPPCSSSSPTSCLGFYNVF